jgi:hypothetical protein
VKARKYSARLEGLHLRARYLNTTTSTSQSECHSSPPTEAILVGPTLYLPSYVLIPCCQDEEKVRTIMTRLLGELLSEME